MGKLFYVPKHEKINEKTMFAHVVLSVTVVIMCLAAMTLSAYAFFSYDLSSDSNVIEAARFEVDIAVQITDQKGNSVDVKKIDKYTSKVKLQKDNTYEIKIENAGTASTGFCVISADNCDVEQMHTQQIYNKKNAAEGEDTELSFKMKVTNDTEVTFYAHWGTSSYYDEFKSKGKDKKFYITQGEKIELSISGAEKDEDAETTDQEPSEEQSEEQSKEQDEEQSEASGNEPQSQGMDDDKNDGQQDNSSAGDLDVKATSAPESSQGSKGTSTGKSTGTSDAGAVVGATPKPM